jgi:UDP-N-acetylglucosamine transferase subunit ALG13
MILMTLGTVSFPFDRAILWLKNLIERGIITESVFLQYGTSNISILNEHRFVESESIVSYDELINLINVARLVISHAGQGSTRLLAEKGAHFVLLPRLKYFGEHVDDHQLLFAQAVSNFGIQSIVTLDKLEKAVLQPPPYFQAQLFDTPKLTDYLLRQYPPQKVA